MEHEPSPGRVWFCRCGAEIHEGDPAQRNEDGSFLCLPCADAAAKQSFAPVAAPLPARPLVTQLGPSLGKISDGEPQWLCQNEQCGFLSRDREIKRVILDGAPAEICPQCGAPVRRIDVQEVARSDERSFTESLLEAFGYPVLGGGLWILGIGTVLFGAVMAVAPLALFFGGTAVLFVQGYLTAYMFDVVLATINGKDAPPDFPEFTDWWDSILRPFLLFLVTTLLCFSPVIATLIGGYLMEDTFSGAFLISVGAAGLLGLGGIFYFPMALLGVALFDNLNGMSPFLVIPSIKRVLVPYLSCCGFLAVVVVSLACIQIALSLLLPWLVAAVISEGVSLYMLMVNMRLLGLLYRSHKDRLAWF